MWPKFIKLLKKPYITLPAVATFLLLVIAFMVYNRFPAKNDMSALYITFMGALAIVFSIGPSAVGLAKNGIKKESVLQTIPGFILCGLIAIFIFISTQQFLENRTTLRSFDGWNILIPKPAEVVLEEIDKTISNLPEEAKDNVENYLIEAASNPQNEDYVHIYPFIHSEYFENIASILEQSPTMFDFIEKSKLLSIGEYEGITYPPNPDIKKLNSSQSVIEELDNKTYEKIVNGTDAQYKEEQAIFNNLLNQTGTVAPNQIDALIDNYGVFINNLEIARNWSAQYAGGVDIDVVLHIARNYAERAYIYAVRGVDRDTDRAIDDYTTAILEYAQAYRMCTLEQNKAGIKDRRILFWLASAYHNLGDIQLDNDEVVYHLGSFVTADSFFTKHLIFESDSFFEAYSRYFSAMDCHKIYNLVYRTSVADSTKLPEAIRFHILEAYVNYEKIKNTKRLRDELQEASLVNIERSIKQIKDARTIFLQQYPEYANFLDF